MHNLARYRVLQRLGAGAAGGVYLVEDRVLGGPPIALKRVEQGSDREFLDSFAREFAVVSSLAVPGVARVHDLGVLPHSDEIEGGPFFTRDYVDGLALAQWSRDRSTEETLALFLRVLSIVGKLHRRGVIHGDLKPANIIVDAAHKPHLIDFGLASRPSERLSGSGTPLFMAPELLGGDSSSMASDIYALGATLWAALVGAAPLEELGSKLIAARLRGVLPNVPADLEPLRTRLLEATLWALAADRRARAPSVDELAARLEQAAGRTVSETRATEFVVPRPRGRGEVLDALSRRALADGAAPVLHVLYGPRGMGKSTLLRELKWRLQLAEMTVYEVRTRDGVSSAQHQLLRQLALARPHLSTLVEAVDAGDAASEGELSSFVPALAEALTAQGGPRSVVLVDDIDHAGRAFSEVLRAALHRGDGGAAPVLLASSESLDASALGSFVDLEGIDLPGLERESVRAIIDETLGPVDEATAEALSSYAGGNPGALIEALRFLWERGDFTARALSEAAPGQIAASLSAARVEVLSSAAKELLLLLAVVREPLAAAVLRRAFTAYESAQAELAAAGLAREEASAIIASERVVTEWMRAKFAGEPTRELCARLLGGELAQELGPVEIAELALGAGDVDALTRSLPEAATLLVARGAAPRAVQLCEAALAMGASEAGVAVLASELYVDIGDCARAAERGEALLARGAELDDVSATRARLAAARGHVAGGKLERAVELLKGVAETAPLSLRAQAARELARVFVRRGDAQHAEQAVHDGLRAASERGPVRVELLAILATLLDQRGEHASANARYDAALELARSLGAAREEALVFGYRGMSHERRGATDAARADYEAGLAAARRAGDLAVTATYALNFGNVSYRSGKLDGVEQSYALASRLARRAGKTSTALLADNNLAHLFVHLGSYSRARLLADATLREAQRLKVDVAEAYALHTLAEIDARSGDRNAALARCEAAATLYERLGRTNQQAEVILHAAEILLDRGGVSDASAASARIAQARELIDKHGHEEFRFRLRLLIARARAGNGDHEGALKELADIERALPGDQDRDLTWRVLAAQAELHHQLGATLLANRKAREAAELIELLAAQVPREAREAFLGEPRRRTVLKLARPELDSAQRASGTEALVSEPRVSRLLELIKRLARERDLDRLLERITDAAVDLSGAERGFVLLADEQGQLAPHTVRASGGAESDPMVAFSRSIAEAVLIDGEPIVTVNARDDRRLNEFMSVHKLMLKSVACIPISGPRGVVGVLYLEHRLRAGRFQESDIDLLLAFADQAAIAIENARLWSENERRQRELEAQARELAAAKADIERLLEARTEELEQTRRDLGRARAELESQSARHGIIGKSPTMRRVFALIDRVADSPVPIVIEGESGTGKELVARAIHYSGGRKKEPFVALNCAALPEQLLESELFGHVRGAFTGADRDKRGLFLQANGGTIFLDEFADVPPRMQVDLLRVLQERAIRPVGSEQDIPIDVRVVAATNRPLKQLVAMGKLREDLYYRMSVVEIRLPALRERPEDIPLLCDHLLARVADRNGGRARKLSRAALDRIVASDLPGNVRQLEHLLTSAAMLADGPFIEPFDLGFDQPEDVGLERDSMPPELDGNSPSDLQGHKNREKQRILDALEKHNWNRAKAATALGMPRRTFYRRLSEFNIL